MQYRTYGCSKPRKNECYKPEKEKRPCHKHEEDKHEKEFKVKCYCHIEKPKKPEKPDKPDRPCKYCCCDKHDKKKKYIEDYGYKSYSYEEDDDYDYYEED